MVRLCPNKTQYTSSVSIWTEFFFFFFGPIDSHVNFIIYDFKTLPSFLFSCFFMYVYQMFWFLWLKWGLIYGHFFFFFKLFSNFLIISLKCCYIGSFIHHLFFLLLSLPFLIFLDLCNSMPSFSCLGCVEGWLVILSQHFINTKLIPVGILPTTGSGMDSLFNN